MNEQSTNNQFKLYIPSEISSDPNLNLSEMRVLATIKALDKDKSCFATNSYMAECLNISTRQVSRIISSLQKKGYILVENKNSFKRKIKMQMNQQVQQVQLEEIPSDKVVPLKQKTKQTKIEKFNAMYTHDWDFEKIELLERKYVDKMIKNMTLSDRGRELINKTKEDYREEPSEWEDISQLAFKEGVDCNKKELVYQ